jgi:hypothetical protein
MHRISLLPIRLMALLITFSYHATAAISTVTITVSSPAIPTSTPYTNDAAFKSAMLAAHNFYRSEHNVSNLAWNDTSAAYASTWAGNCVFKHSVSISSSSSLPCIPLLSRSSARFSTHSSGSELQKIPFKPIQTK